MIPSNAALGLSAVGLTLGSSCLSRAAWTLWMLGYPDQALTRSWEALTLAQELSHAYSLGFALYFAAVLHKWRREVQLVQELGRSSDCALKRAGICTVVGRRNDQARLGAGRAGGSGGRHCATRSGSGHLAGYGRRAGIIARSLVSWPRHIGKEDKLKRGCACWPRHITAVHKNAERYYEAELYRLKGELLLRQTIPEAAS